MIQDGARSPNQDPNDQGWCLNDQTPFDPRWCPSGLSYLLILWSILVLIQASSACTQALWRAPMFEAVLRVSALGSAAQAAKQELFQLGSNRWKWHLASCRNQHPAPQSRRHFTSPTSCRPAVRAQQRQQLNLEPRTLLQTVGKFTPHHLASYSNKNLP